ncbi:MAG TPA: pyridoxal phosphate-dependent aminotransferase [Vicinamibacterales bacterium]|nr:pyridoxal phosphate-dependent aminotransferase [Vicinamibacterales bacterium]
MPGTMTPGPALSSLVRDQINRPSPIRQIMKMAERQNILAMGLDPANVISFGGGWVNHSAPDAFRQAYESIVADAELFHKSGGYTATLGDMECREQIARFEEHLFGVPRLGAEHIAIGMGSTQLTHDLFRTLLDPGDTVMLLDPTYANYEGQLAFSVPGVKIVRLRVLDPQTWSYLPETDPAGTAREFSRLFDQHRPRMVLFGAPDNPTSQVVPQSLADVMLAKTSEAGAWLAIDFAYKAQYFQAPPAYYAWSPADHPNVVGIHSNSKWARGLGRRLGWIEAQTPVVEAIERVQQCSILCPDTLSQMTMARYLKGAIADGSLKKYVADANALYKNAAAVTLKAIDTHLQRPRLTPFGGLYTVVDIGTNADEFVPKALKATGVLVVPGGGFGESLKNGVRISFGPLVKDTAKIDEGLARLGTWMRGTQAP